MIRHRGYGVRRWSRAEPLHCELRRRSPAEPPPMPCYLTSLSLGFLSFMMGTLLRPYSAVKIESSHSDRICHRTKCTEAPVQGGLCRRWEGPLGDRVGEAPSRGRRGSPAGKQAQCFTKPLRQDPAGRPGRLAALTHSGKILK